MPHRSTTLFCFSPPVMLATFIIEVAFAIYIIWRYRLTTVSRLVIAILGCLAVFQGAEYLICGGLGIQGGSWSRIGYSAITLLPPLGIHLTLAITKQKKPQLLAAAYGTAALFVLYFAFMTQAISGYTCYANYAVFETTQFGSLMYALYYYGWLITGVTIALRNARTYPTHSRALRALAFGYLAFILPTTTINLIDATTIAGIPSIMCGFAVVLAFVLTLRVAPEVALKNDHLPRKLFRLPFQTK